MTMDRMTSTPAGDRALLALAGLGASRLLAI